MLLCGKNEGPHSQFYGAGGKQQAPPAGGEHLHWEEGEGGLQQADRPRAVAVL